MAQLQRPQVEHALQKQTENATATINIYNYARGGDNNRLEWRNITAAGRVVGPKREFSVYDDEITLVRRRVCSPSVI